ncbi:MAG: hypothetical protein ACYSW8_32010 [Planctomycetota bacterium]|jgi:hypothetical protein
MSSVLEALQTLIDNGLPEGAVVPIINDLFEGGGWEDDDDKRACALVAHRAEWENEVDCNAETCIYDDCIVAVGGNEYLVLDGDEKEKRWEDALEQLLDDCIEGADGPYFDREAWKRDARFDGAGHTLASYDGAEHEFSGGGEWFHIFRVN